MRRAFTLIELLVVIAVVGLLIGLVLVGLSGARNAAANAADRQSVGSLKVAVEQFRNDNGFLPHMVKDRIDSSYYRAVFKNSEPVESNIPQVFSFSMSDTAERAYLRGVQMRNDPNIPDHRFSVYSLAYYLVGALPEDIDRVKGQGSLRVERDGSFANSGERAPVYYDVGSNAKAVVNTDPMNPLNGRFELRDRNGNPFRYYRWLQGDNSAGTRTAINSIEDLNVPEIVGDPRERNELRDAGFAIVAAGSDGVFGDLGQTIGTGGTEDDEAVFTAADLAFDPSASPERIADAERRAREDNVVEVGRK